MCVDIIDELGFGLSYKFCVKGLGRRYVGCKSDIEW